MPSRRRDIHFNHIRCSNCRYTHPPLGPHLQGYYIHLDMYIFTPIERKRRRVCMYTFVDQVRVPAGQDALSRPRLVVTAMKSKQRAGSSQTYNLVFSTSGRLRSRPVSSSSGTTHPSSSSCLRCWPPPLAGSAGLARSSIGGASSRTISASETGFDIAKGCTWHSSIAIGVCKRRKCAPLNETSATFKYTSM